ncbi:hypothetical protein IIA79_07735 [bacterium]|nr:hypothetical protein [bacterium]
MLLLEVGTGGNLMAKTWGGNSYDRPDSMLMSGGNLILSGSRTSIGNPADGLLLSFSTDGGIQSAEVWDRQDDSCRLYGLSYFPGGGILISGYGEAAQDGAWTAVAGTLANANSLWVDQVGTITNPVGTIASPTGTLTDITEGVIDTGGGDDDALLMLRKSP